MTGVIQAYGPCWCCKGIFAFNPHRVPSLPVNGVREPICQNCVERANPRRIANGLPPIEPLPGAYESMNEEDWIGED